MFTFVLRIVLFLMGLVFAASIACAVMVVGALWALRYGWARLTGKPVTPWVMRFRPGQGFERFRAAAAARRSGPTAADVAGARARGESVSSPVMHLGPGGGEVTDVRSRPLDSRS